MHKMLLITVALLPLSAHAAGMDHSHHSMIPAVSKKLVKNPSVKANIAAMKKMHEGMNITYTGDADIDFTRGMVPHHQGAVDMVAVLQQYGKDAELQALGKRIVIAQNTEIGMMKRWLETRDNKNLPKADCKDPVVVEFKNAMEKMHKNMNIKYTGNADLDFVNGMIPHHQGAIDMAWVLIKHGRDPMLRELAHDVVRSQGQEIAFMKEWLEKHNGHTSH